LTDARPPRTRRRLTIPLVRVWLSTNENAATAYRVLDSGSSLLASGSVGAVTLANYLADFVALSTRLFGRRSCIRVSSSAPVPACPSARAESLLTDSDPAA
jgi:hypothetical protein